MGGISGSEHHPLAGIAGFRVAVIQDVHCQRELPVVQVGEEFHAGVVGFAQLHLVNARPVDATGKRGVAAELQFQPAFGALVAKIIAVDQLALRRGRRSMGQGRPEQQYRCQGQARRKNPLHLLPRSLLKPVCFAGYPAMPRHAPPFPRVCCCRQPVRSAAGAAPAPHTRHGVAAQRKPTSETCSSGGDPSRKNVCALPQVCNQKPPR